MSSLFNTYSSDCGTFLIDSKYQLAHFIFNIPVDVNNTGCVFKDRFYLSCNIQSTFMIRSVHFANQSCKNRRSRWNFRNFYCCIIFGSNFLYRPANPFCDCMTLITSVIFINKVNLQVGNIWTLAHKVMSYKPVEIHRRCATGINFIVSYFRNCGNIIANLASELCCSFKSSSFRCVNHNLELTFIIKWQHLHLNSSCYKHVAGSNSHQCNNSQS